MEPTPQKDGDESAAGAPRTDQRSEDPVKKIAETLAESEGGISGEAVAAGSDGGLAEPSGQVIAGIVKALDSRPEAEGIVVLDDSSQWLTHDFLVLDEAATILGTAALLTLTERGEMFVLEDAPPELPAGAVGDLAPETAIIHVSHGHRLGDAMWVRASDWHPSAALVWGVTSTVGEQPGVVVYDRQALESWK